MSIILYIFNLLVFAAVVGYLYRNSGSLKKYIIPAVIFKVLCGLALGILYSQYYSYGDTWSFFNEASRLSHLAITQSGDFLKFLVTSSNDIFHSGYENRPRALFFVKILAFINLFTGSNYWLSSVYFSLFSFSGVWFLSRALLERYPHYKSAIVFSFFIFPSSIFWSSGLIKESIATGCIGFIFGLAITIIHKKEVNLSRIVFLLLFILFLWRIKYYYAGVIILLLSALIFTVVLKNKFEGLGKKKWLTILLFFGSAFLMALFVSQLHPNFYLERFLKVLVNNYYSYVKISEPGDFIKFEGLSASWLNVISNAPQALLSGLFRPFVGESKDLFKILSGIENSIVLFLCISAFYHWRKKLNSTDFLLVAFVLSFVILMAVFLTLSTPNFGTLIRYKSGFLPIFIFLLAAGNPIIKKLIP